MRRQRARVRGEVFSIGVYAGASPLALSPAPGATNPVLTRDQVTDALAAFVADPFMIRAGGRWYMFFEVMNCRPEGRRGEIAFATSDDGLRWRYQRIVLAEPFHLSYPHVFASGADHFMIPESSAAGAVRLYRADPFPERWVFVGDLITGPILLDNSIVQHEGRWWLFTETAAKPAWDTLRLFEAPALTGPWTEHPRSPVVRGDSRIARPAGRVIATKGRLIRFAQDCSAGYGVSVRALEITRLDTTEYEEVELGGDPVLAGSGAGWNGRGMHQLDAHLLGDGRWIACVDGWNERFRRPREVLQWAVNRWR
jgi:hypothetical protein